MNEIKANERFGRAKLKEIENKVNAVKSQVAQKQAQLEQKVAEAAAITDRHETLRAVSDILNQINELQLQIVTAERSLDVVAKVIDEHEKLQEKYSIFSQHVLLLMQNAKELEIATKKRKRYYKVMEEFFITSLKYSFETVLEMRQFKVSFKQILSLQHIAFVICLGLIGNRSRT